MPGSRKSEVSLLGNEMVNAARALKKLNSGYKFFMPLSDKGHLKFLDKDINDFVDISFGNAQEVLKKSEIAIITSGTATLESILSSTPCVTLYRTNWLSYLIIKPLLKIDSFSLPNLIAGKEILPELLQTEISTEKVIDSINLIKNKGLKFFRNEFESIRIQLKAGGAEKAAQEIFKILN